MTGRVLLIPAFLVCLSVLIGPGRPPAGRPPVPESPAPDATTPIVAIRGEPLARYEEPLPPGARVRIGSTRFRHPTDLRRAEWVAAKDYFATTQGGRLTLTELATGRRVWTDPIQNGKGSGWTGYGSVGCVASPEGNRLVTWDDSPFLDDGEWVRLWELNPDPARPIRPGAVLQFPTGRAPSIHRAAFTPDGRELILVGRKDVHMFDPATGRLLRQIASETDILDVAPAAGRFLVSSEEDPTATVLSFHGMVWIPTFCFRKPDEPDVEPPGLPRGDDPRMYRRPGQTLPGQPFASFDLSVRDMAAGKVVASIPAPRNPGATIGHFHMSPDGRYVSAEFENDVLVWEVETGRRLLRVSPAPARGRRLNWISEVQFLAGGQLLVKEQIGRERRFDLASGRESPTEERRPGDGAGPSVRSVPAIEVDESGAIRRRNPRTGQVIPPPPGYTDVVMDVSPGGQFIAIGDAAGRLDVWRVDGRLVRTLSSGGPPVEAVAFSPDGTRLAASDRAPVLRVWSVGSWRERHRLDVPVENPSLWPDRLTFTPDSSQLLLSRGEMMALWEPGVADWVWDRADERTDPRSYPPPVFTPDGRFIVFGSHGRHYSQWLDAVTGALAREFPHVGPPDGHSSVSCVVVSPDGRTLASLHNERTLRIHDIATGALAQVFPGSEAIVVRANVLRFSPDGRRVVTCDDSGHAYAWEVATGQLAFTLTYPDGAIDDAHFGRDGRSLITANHREVIVWDLSPEPGGCADPWADVGHEAPRAEQARRTLLTDPAAAVALLRRRLQPAEPLNDAAVRRLVRSLDADDYRDRQRAAAGLLTMGRRVLPRLKEAKATSEEGTARLAGLVRDLSAGLTADERRQVRGIEVLEQIGTPAARALIAYLATGDPAAVITEEAAKSVRVSNPVVVPSPAAKPLARHPPASGPPRRSRSRP
jgi:WD40 repeat protein